jgi:hypothetical protein
MAERVRADCGANLMQHSCPIWRPVALVARECALDAILWFCRSALGPSNVSNKDPRHVPIQIDAGLSPRSPRTIGRPSARRPFSLDGIDAVAPAQQQEALASKQRRLRACIGATLGAVSASNIMSALGVPTRSTALPSWVRLGPTGCSFGTSAYPQRADLARPESGEHIAMSEMTTRRQPPT